ncbi:MAG: ParB/RepB/Spo0J family partition protein [Thermoleophilaceae bacterium]
MPEAAAVAKSGQSRGMGRGLSAILPRTSREDGTLRELPLDLVKPNERQPRRDFDKEALVALSESIKARGVLQPIVVRPLADGSYELIAGERRLRASRIAGLDAVPAIVRETADAERLELALIENVVREDLNPVEEARACATLVEDLGVTKEELARRLGRSRPRLSNLIRILNLPDAVLESIETGALSEAHGRAILECPDHDARRRLAERALRDGWSVRETERRAKLAKEGPAARPPKGELHPDLAEALATAEDALSSALGRDVRVKPRGSRFRVELELDDLAEAVELARRLRAA